MYMLKICSRDAFSEFRNKFGIVIDELLKQSFEVHTQELDNHKYFRWLTGMSTMEWRSIIDVFWDESLISHENATKTVKSLLNTYCIDMTNLDMYLAEQIRYKEPVNDAEVITSCYLWNYKNTETVRIEKMREHFGMEQQQYYYDYVAFQCVKSVLTPSSPRFDFFFESHVSDPEGIDAIYSKPTLNGMRQHSEAFLNVNTRQLSFGKVSCYGGKS